jgi:hypothetical protein
MQRLCAEVDIGFFQIITNDSGAGVCWSTGLYNVQRARGLPQGEHGGPDCWFLQVLYDAARSRGVKHSLISQAISSVQGAGASMDAAWTSLKPASL